MARPRHGANGDRRTPPQMAESPEEGVSSNGQRQISIELDSRMYILEAFQHITPSPHGELQSTLPADLSLPSHPSSAFSLDWLHNDLVC